MNPFKITCVTCRARLAVRSEALIGHILACPKCGSMVQVTAPPTGAVAPDSGSGSTIILTGSTVVPPVAAAAAPVDAPATFDEVADIHAPLDGAPAQPPATPIAAPTPPPPTPIGMTRVKLAALVGVGGVAGSALVAAVMWALSAEPDAPAPSAAVATKQSPTVDEPEPSLALPAIDAEIVDEEPAAPSSESITAAPEGDPLVAPITEASSDPPTATVEATVDASPPVSPTPPDAAPPVVTETSPAAPVEDNEPRLRIDPLDLDPEGLDLTTLTGGPAADPLAASEIVEEPAEPVGGSVVPVVPDDGAPPAEPEPIRFEPVGPPANVDSLLARKLPAVTIEKMPLCRFLDFATELSGLPVSVAPAELRLAAVSAATPVSANSENATIEELLAAALKPLRLAPTVANSQIVLRRLDADKRRELVYPVDDLAEGAAEIERLAGWVQELVAPESWESSGGEGTLTVDGTTLRVEHVERVGYETLLLLEQYRLARGLPPRSKYPADLLPQPGAAADLAASLGEPVTFTFSPAAPLRAVARWWQEESQTAILVDWPALADQRTWPHSRITTSAVDKPWSDAVDEALAPLGLGWRVVDARTIEITSLEKIRREPLLQVYRLPAAAAARSQDVIAKIEQLAAEEGADVAPAAALDAEHGVLLVRQSAAAHRRLADWLAADGLAAGE